MSDSALRDMLPQVSSSSILDALLARITHPAHILDLKSPTPGAVLFGRAATIRFFPTRKDIQHPVDNDFAALFYRAITAQGGGDGVVLVMSNGGYPDAALGGGRKLTRLRHTGVAGVLTDGRLRDLEGIGTYGFVTYCNGETIRQGGNQVMAMAADVPVEIRGVGVIPGDYVYADAAGAVIVPAGLIAEVLEDAANRERKDLASMERMKDEDPETVMAQGEAK